jgi:hypothetical protein
MYFLSIFSMVDSDWVSIVEKFGIPMAILTAFAYFVSQGIRWFGCNVVVPMKDRHMSFLDNMEKCLDKITDLQTKIFGDTSSIRADIDRVDRKTTALAKDSGILRERMEGLIIQTMAQNGKYDSKIVNSLQSDTNKEQ